MPRSQVRILNPILRSAILESQVRTERDIAVLKLAVRNILLVDSVLVAVDQVVPLDVILQLFLEISAELVDILLSLLFCNISDHHSTFSADSASSMRELS